MLHQVHSILFVLLTVDVTVYNICRLCALQHNLFAHVLTLQDVASCLYEI